MDLVGWLVGVDVYAVVGVDRDTTQQTGETHFRVEIVSQDGVPSFGPPLPNPPVFHKDAIKSFLIPKCMTDMFQCPRIDLIAVADTTPLLYLALASDQR
jgi:hypothetical protein